MTAADLSRAIILRPTDGALAIARALHQRGVDVHMLVAERNWIGSTRWATQHVVGELPAAADSWVRKLEELATAGDGVLLSSTDRTTELLVAERERIPANLASFESPSSAHLALMDKASLYEIAARAGVRCPQTARLRRGDDLERVTAEATFPCLIKPVAAHRWRDVFGERRTILVSDSDDLERQAAPALDAGLDLLVSQHIPGPDASLEGAYTIRRADGSYPLVCGRRKVRMHPPGYGAAAIMETADVPETVALSRKLLDAAGFVGVSSVETKRHAETGDLYLIEVNVRVPQAWGVVEAAGTDGSWRLYATLAGLGLGPQRQPRTGARTVVPSLELRAVPTHLYERRLRLAQVLRGHRGVRSWSGLTWRDPRPLVELGRFYGAWVLGHLRSMTSRG